MGSPDIHQPATLAEASATGLVLDFGYKRQRVAWFEVEDIAVGTMSGSGDGILFTLAIGLTNGRTIVTREGRPVWRSLIEALPHGLPDVMPFNAWSTTLIDEAARTIVIYVRQPVGTA